MFLSHLSLKKPYQTFFILNETSLLVKVLPKTNYRQSSESTRSLQGTEHHLYPDIWVLLLSLRKSRHGRIRSTIDHWKQLQSPALNMLWYCSLSPIFIQKQHHPSPQAAVFLRSKVVALQPHSHSRTEQELGSVV